MKKLIIILLLTGLTGVLGSAYAQVRNFSDWNVPPPIPPGTIVKGAGNTKIIVIPQTTDIPAPSMPKAGEIRLGKLQSVLLEHPDVHAPDQPAFPELPFVTPDIPLPTAPEAMGAPQKVPQEELNGAVINFPDPKTPEMPDFPKRPDITADKSPNNPVPIPITPALPSPQITAVLSGIPFSFTEWSIPAIPSNTNFVLVLPQSTGTVIPAPKTVQKPKKTTRVKH